MFNIIRSYPEPLDLSRKVYNSPEIVDQLRGIFYDKCYLCEQGDLSDPEVEHFLPHGGSDELLYGWDNLFYSCSRCNSIKSNTHVNLLNCASNDVDVFEEIIHLAGNSVNGIIDVRPSSDEPTQETLNTVELLRKCYNSENTGFRGITKENLMEKIQNDFAYYTELRMVLANLRSTEEQIIQAIDRMKVICRPSYPFSVFWRWHILTDTRLNRIHNNIRQLLDF
ncbi:HNH endonuclease [Citrobacter portucalensis]|uniref:HNH endonuclease n=1 Tax=Citrobacter portucalensis TaxID=1639133 RepID=UPI003896D4CA